MVKGLQRSVLLLGDQWKSFIRSWWEGHLSRLGEPRRRLLTVLLCISIILHRLWRASTECSHLLPQHIGEGSISVVIYRWGNRLSRHWPCGLRADLCFPCISLSGKEGCRAGEGFPKGKLVDWFRSLRDLEDEVLVFWNGVGAWKSGRGPENSWGSHSALEFTEGHSG